MAYIDKELFKQDIKMRYCNNCARPNEIKCRVCHIDDMLGEIEDAPTADVEEVKHGEWILIDDCANEGVYCSVCHKKVYKTDYANQKIKSPRCPNCGAKMDGRSDKKRILLRNS